MLVTQALLALLVPAATSTPALPTVFGRSRFTLLAPALWRLERSPPSTPPRFDDRATTAIVRRQPLPLANVSHPTNASIVLCSPVSCLHFVEDGAPAFTAANTLVTALLPGGGAPLRWTPASVQRTNLNGTYVSLDCYSDPATCYQCYLHDPACTGWEFGMEKGLLARDGWNVLDDTQGLRVGPAEAGIFPTWSNETILTQDLYFHAFGDSYRAALTEFTQLAGRPGLVPRAAMGVMWSRYFPYSAASFTEEILEGFGAHGVPLHAVFLDMDWHTLPTEAGCNSWGTYDFNITLFPKPAAFLALLHSPSNPIGHPLAVSLNLHPQTGVDHCESRYAQFAAAMGVDPATNATIACALHNATFAAALLDVELGPPPLGAIDFMWTDFGGCGAPLPPAAPLPPPAPPSPRAAAQSAQLWATLGVFGPAAAAQGRRPVVASRQGGLGNHRIPFGFSGDTLQHELMLDYEVSTTATAANILNSWWSHDRK